MPQAFVEQRFPGTRPATAAPQKQATPRQNVIAWTIMIVLAICLFLYLQSTRPPPRAPAVVPARQPIRWDALDLAAVGAIIVGCAALYGAVVWAVRRARRPTRIDVLRWRFDDTGIYTEAADREDFSSWEWVSAITPVSGGLMVDRGILGRRRFDDSAFSDAAERERFLETFKRNAAPEATEIKHVGGRGFEV